MELNVLLSLIAFAWISCFTPGPNNLLLTASGARFGLRHSVAHIFGVSAGLMLMLLMMACGIGALFLKWPFLQMILKVGGSFYLLYLAWMIAKSGAPKMTQTSNLRPWRFHQATLFQFMNPKAWLMCISAIGSFTAVGEKYWLSVALILMVFALVGLKTSSVWTIFGVKLSSWLKTPEAWQRWNWVMAALTVGCIYLIWCE